MGDAMLGVGRGQAAPCSSSLRAGEGMKSAGGENPACTRTLLHVPGPAGVLHNPAIEAVNGIQAAKGNLSSLICAEQVPAFFNCADTGLCLNTVKGSLDGS